jgi:hypothetical protein
MTKAIKLIVLLLSCVVTSIEGFTFNFHGSHIETAPLLAANDNEFEGFNPFQPGSKISKSTSGITVGSARSNETPGGRISPRAMKMKELTASLFQSISDKESVQQILNNHEDFLLEQFNNLGVVLEEDSIFTPDMSREERFQRYKVVMEERIQGARAPAAKNILIALREFVLSKE